MLNYLWAGMTLAGILWGAFHGQLSAVTDGALQAAKEAVTLCITMLGVMTLWTGVLEIAHRAGLVDQLSRKMAPVLRFLFPRLEPEGEARKQIAVNMIANVLGLGWAATPAGLSAMEELKKVEEERRQRETRDSPEKGPPHSEQSRRGRSQRGAAQTPGGRSQSGASQTRGVRSQSGASQTLGVRFQSGAPQTPGARSQGEIAQTYAGAPQTPGARSQGEIAQTYAGAPQTPGARSQGEITQTYTGASQTHGDIARTHSGKARRRPPKAQPPGTANNEMCTFLIINISSLQLIPINMIAYRSQYGSVNPGAIMGPALVATLVSTVVAVIYCKVMDL